MYHTLGVIFILVVTLASVEMTYVDVLLMVIFSPVCGHSIGLPMVEGLSIQGSTKKGHVLCKQYGFRDL